MYENLEECCQLHEQIEIIYVVDGYLVTLTNENEQRIASAKGVTIEKALQNLNNTLHGTTHADVKRMRHNAEFTD